MIEFCPLKQFFSSNFGKFSIFLQKINKAFNFGCLQSSRCTYPNLFTSFYFHHVWNTWKVLVSCRENKKNHCGISRFRPFNTHSNSFSPETSRISSVSAQPKLCYKLRMDLIFRSFDRIKFRNQHAKFR
jgi:hypothetical protein